MKRVFAFTLLISIFLTIGCGSVGNRNNEAVSAITSYREIPGVTEEEIEAIEALKGTKDRLVYGSNISTAAFILPDGTYAGFTAKFCELLSSLFDMEIALEFCEWDDLTRRLNEKSIDFANKLSSDSRNPDSYYMTHPIAEQTLSLYIHTDFEEVHTEMDLQGLRVGFLEGTDTVSVVRRNYPVVFEAVEIDSYSKAVSMLKAGSLDAFVGESVVDPLFAEYGFISSRKFFSLVYNPVSLTTANPELEPFISVLDKYLVAGGIDKLFDFYRQGEREYAKYKLNNSFTEEEKAYLNALAEGGSRIPAAYEYENYPVSFYNEADQEYQGFAVDILEEITYFTGMKFESATQKGTPWPEILEKVKSGEVAMVTQLLYSDARKNDYLWSNVPYAASYYALLSKLDYPEIASYQVIRSRVGVIEQTGHEDMYREWFPDSNNTISYKNHEDALIALEQGDIDLLMASEYTLFHQTNYREKPGFKVNVRLGVPLESFFGFYKEETMLRAVIDKTLPYVDTDAIVRGWTERVFDYSRKYAVRFNWLLSFFVAVLLAALILAVHLWLKSNRFRQDLERKTTTLSTIFTTMPDLLYSKDIHLRYTSCNPSFEKLAGCKEDAILGRDTLEIFTGDRQDMARRFMEVDERVIRDNATQTVEDWYDFPDGSRRLFEAIKTPLIQNGAVVGVMGISRDITEHKEAEEEAKAASKAKSAFLAHMSHEIRTPMNAISGMTELILREEIPSRIFEYILSIKHASANLLSLINDVLDFSKIEAGGLEIVPTQYSLASLINDVLMIIRMRIREKPILFTVNVGCNIPDQLIGDATRIRQILLNLLGNAVNYTNEGFISLSMTGEIDDKGVLLRIGVSDSGIGIRKEDAQKLFGDFVRFDTARNKKVQGTGLGLAITKNLCQAMGGDISVQSEYGVGSTFFITIPQAFTTPDEIFACVDDPDSRQILVYETRSLYADSISRSLTDLGVRHTLVIDLQEFTEALKSAPYSHAFVSSPFSEDAERVIRELERNVRIVLLMELGAAMAEYHMRDLQTIAMPVHSASIANLLNEVSSDALYKKNGKEKAKFIAPSAKILVVDDLKTNLTVAKGLLLPYQMQVDLCESGAEAIRHVREQQYDIIFMDHMMPEMDGIEAARGIRSMEDGNGYYGSVPIIALTANAIAGMREMFLQNGMNDFLAKPIDISKLNSLLERWIPKEKRKKYRKTTRGHLPEASNPAQIHISGVDVPAGIAMTGGSVENYLKLLAIFRMEGTEKIDLIRSSMKNNDISLYMNQLHTLKSAAATIGAGKASELAKELELAGSNGDTSFIRENTERFIEQMEAIFRDISAVTRSKEPGRERSGDAGLTRKKLMLLKEALYNMDAGAVDDIMDELGLLNRNPEEEALFQEISQAIFRFQYMEAELMIEKLLADM